MNAGICDRKIISAQLAEEGKRADLVDASVRVSVEYLPERTRQNFFRLVAFPRDFDLAGVAAVIGLSEELASDEVGQILTHSLLQWDSDDERYELHDLVRDYVKKHVTDTERSAAYTFHALYYLEAAKQTEGLYRLRGEHVFEALELFDLERTNITAGFIHATMQMDRTDEAAVVCNEFVFATTHCRDIRFTSQEQLMWLDAWNACVC